jgi:Tfp pilus assembly protein PilF
VDSTSLARPNERETLLGVIELHRCGRIREAIDGYRALLAGNPRLYDAHRLLGAALLSSGSYAQAADSLGRALEISTVLPEVWTNRAEALAHLGRHVEAAECFERALAIAPTAARTWCRLGLQWLALERWADALPCFDRALELDSRSAAAWSNRGSVLLKLGRAAESLASHQRAAAESPGAADILCNLALTQMHLRRFEDSLASYERALAAMPASEAAWRGKTASLTALGRYAEALESSHRTLEHALAEKSPCTPDDAPQVRELIFSRSLLQLTMGDYSGGWDGYESRPSLRPGQGQAMPAGARAWQPNEPIQGRSILLTHEQGLGDTIQFCRFAPALARLGARVILHVQPDLATLLHSLHGVEQVVASDRPAPPADLFCPLPSLAHRLGVTPATLVPFEPYLAPPATKSTQWRAALGVKRRPRVGLVYSGNPAHVNDIARSIPLRRLAPLCGRDVEWHLLQKDLHAADDEQWLKTFGIVDHRDALDDFSDTAALATAMDLIISVDTCAAHLAGAIGLPLFLLLPFVPDWRWLLDRADSPWYPSARLFRQERRDDWDGVLQRVSLALQAHFAAVGETASKRAS